MCKTWINSDEVELFNNQGYNTYHCCNDNYRAEGVVICYIDTDITVTNLNIKLITSDVLFLKFIINLLFKILKKRPYEKQFVQYFNSFSPNLRDEVNEVRNRYYANTILDLKVIAPFSGR